MLSFKHYLQSDRYRDQVKRSVPQPSLPRTPTINEAKPTQGNELMAKWDFIRMLAEDPSEVLQVEFGDKAVTFAFVEIEKSGD